MTAKRVAAWRCGWMAVAALLAVRSASAQYGGAEQRARVKAVRTDRAPVQDGTLRDTLWLRGARISNFRQREPFEGREASESTSVFLLYDRHNLYIGVRCFDRQPGNIVATELRRDADPGVDDHFAVLISPGNDRRSGYTFAVNPLGT